MTDSIRLAKHLAKQIACSRSEAEQYIAGGWVLVDGVVVEQPGLRIDASAVVSLHPEASLAAIVAVTLLLHKPPGLELLDDPTPALALLCTSQRSSTDRSGQRLLQRHLQGLTIATPLGRAASGLVVLTQDFRVARKLVDDAARIEHEFIVEVSGQIAADGLARLNAGIALPGRAPGSVKVSWQNETRLRFAAKALKSGHICVMCAAVGLQVQGMKRIRSGRVSMASLAAGQWRYLLGYERF